jgi:hypothetical protein
MIEDVASSTQWAGMSPYCSCSLGSLLLIKLLFCDIHGFILDVKQLIGIEPSVFEVIKLSLNYILLSGNKLKSWHIEALIDNIRGEIRKTSHLKCTHHLVWLGGARQTSLVYLNWSVEMIKGSLDLRLQLDLAWT